MKAVKRFKNSIAHRRPPHMDGILGAESRMVQPPMSMLLKPEKTPTSHKTRSLDFDDRNPIEKILVTEGVHRDINLDSFNEKPPPEKMDSAVSFSAEQTLSPTDPKSPTHSSHIPLPNPQSTLDHPGKGHAHNPLSDHLFLAIGPSGSGAPPDPPAVSESPGAVDINIYETAYQNEVERIREKQGRAATLYLTRRVEGKREFVGDEGLIRGSSGSGGKAGWGKLLELARGKGGLGEDRGEGKEEGKDGESEEKAGQDKPDEKMSDV